MKIYEKIKHIYFFLNKIFNILIKLAQTINEFIRMVDIYKIHDEVT